MMDYYRAKEILNSTDTIEVLFNESPVWINNLDPKKRTAQVTDVNQNNLDVPVDELVESHRLH